ncbi:Dihydrofolate reductase incomplete domain containing protein [Pandoravirus macleodensis]|uniref:Dihydrofolate reductase incomplete domain containing protein n=1 Tax=Pandoravirus macleodensis TaxID=2107707 RepID=A0A2U7UGF4_9VIRU|nr:Dihydrofolate reductase incomplete domain containing protein [Pandoravirus macleodensis]AVK77542.1 Dihydrofolate reductase incomplete domain containing protein [Pandoravirus macleodensis]
MQDAQPPKDGARRGSPAVHVVVCTDNNDTIMVDGALPWSFRAAYQRAAIDDIVSHATVILGARSTHVFGGAPPGGDVIILSRDGTAPMGMWSRAHIARSPEAALAMCSRQSAVYVLGGASTFAAFMPYASVVHRIVVVAHGLEAAPVPPGSAVVCFPWLGRAGGRTTRCKPLVPGRGGYSYQMRSDTLAPIDHKQFAAPASPPPGAPLSYEDADLEQAKMISFYQHAMQTALETTETLPGGGAPDDETLCEHIDDDDWYIGSDLCDDSDATAGSDDECRSSDDFDDYNDDGDDSSVWADSDEGDDPLAHRARSPCGSKRKMCGCMIARLGRHDGALAAAVIQRLDQCDLLALCRTSPDTRRVLADVLARVDGPLCSSDWVRMVAGRLGDGQESHFQIWVSPCDMPLEMRAGAAWLLVCAVPRLQSKYAPVQQALNQQMPSSMVLPFAAYGNDAIERALAWASATRCGAGINACLALSDSLSAASTAYAVRLDRFAKCADDVDRVDAWLADVMGVAEGAVADLAVTDVWASALGLATAAGRLRSDLLLTLACWVAESNLATGRRFSHLGRRLVEPIDTGERASLASCRLIAAIVRGLSQARCASDPPRCADDHGDRGDDDDNNNNNCGGDDECAARLLRRLATDGLIDDAVMGACRDQPNASAVSAIDEACNHLCIIATQQRTNTPHTRQAACAALARIFVLASPIDCPNGLRAHSLTARLWSTITPDLAKTRAESFWSALNTEPEPAFAQGMGCDEKAHVILCDRHPGGGGAHHMSYVSTAEDTIAVGSGDVDHPTIDGNCNPPAVVDDGNGDPATLIGLLEHEIDICTEIVAFLQPWDVVSLFTTSRAVFKAVWYAVCRATLDAKMSKLTSLACGGSVDIGSGGTQVTETMMPPSNADFAHALGALMLTCHRMPRMEMIANDVETAAGSMGIADDERDAIIATLERDPNLAAMLADTVARAARLGCGAVISRCVRVARRMQDVVKRRMYMPDNARLDAWLIRQMTAARPAHDVDISNRAWLPVAALAYAAGEERSVALLLLACAQVAASSGVAGKVATIFWASGGRRVDMRNLVDGADLDTDTKRVALVVLACIVGATRKASLDEPRPVDDTFFAAVEALISCLYSQGKSSDVHASFDAEPGSPAWHIRRLRVGITGPATPHIASMCLNARFLIAPPGRPLPKHSTCDRIACLLVDVAACHA